MELDDAQRDEPYQALRMNGPSTSGSRRRSVFCLAIVGFLVALVVTDGLISGANDAPTVNYLNTKPGVEYVGDEACRQFHLAKYESFKRTGMGRSMSRPMPDDLGVFSKAETVHSKQDGHIYSVYVENGKAFHREAQIDSVRKPDFTETHEVAYSVGSGQHGRSYLIERGDSLFISPLSYYTSVRKWDLSLGYELDLFRGFTRPAGDLCVYCHSGLSQPIRGTTNQYLKPAFRILPIGCERCHGPGALHVAERRAAKPLEGSLDRSIVNPRDLPARLRDDVCYQCHLAGDARVQRLGKNALDFRPGTLLDDVVSVFMVPTSLKVGGAQALSQVEQIQMSRCRQPDGSRLNCITCHDPHVQSEGAKAAEYFRSKCVNCHAPESPGFVARHRAAKSPPDNCISCHMPKAALTNIAHVSYTDHRIPKLADDAQRTTAKLDADPETNLIWMTRPTNVQKPDLRTLALAFAQLAPDYPGYGARGFPLLEQAGREFPNDPNVQITYGQVLLIAQLSPDYREKAKRAFERAIAAGSKSAAVRRRLAQLLIEEGDPRGLELLRDAIQLDRYDAATYLQLARAYLEMSKRREAAQMLEQVLNFDPGNPDARELLQKLPP